MPAYRSTKRRQHIGEGDGASISAQGAMPADRSRERCQFTVYTAMPGYRSRERCQPIAEGCDASLSAIAPLTTWLQAFCDDATSARLRATAHRPRLEVP